MILCPFKKSRLPTTTGRLPTTTGRLLTTYVGTEGHEQGIEQRVVRMKAPNLFEENRGRTY